MLFSISFFSCVKAATIDDNDAPNDPDRAATLPPPGAGLFCEIEWIKSSVLKFEPRITNLVVTTTVYPDSNELNCTVQYDIVGLPAPTQEVDVLLFPARV